MKLPSVLSLLFLLNSSSCQIPNMSGPVFQFDLFQNSPVAELSRAVENDDSAMMIKSLSEKPNINYQDPKYGSCLLSLSIVNFKPIATKLLLQYGADPNLRSLYTHSTPFLTACEYGLSANYQYNPQNWRTTFVLLLDHGANVNDSVTTLQTNDSVRYDTVTDRALKYLVHFSPVDIIKLLLDRGARLDAFPKNGENSILVEAIYNLPVLRYLLEERNVAIPDYAVIRQQGTPNERKLTLRELLTEITPALKPDQKNILSDIEAFLIARGG